MDQSLLLDKDLETKLAYTIKNTVEMIYQFTRALVNINKLFKI